MMDDLNIMLAYRDTDCLELLPYYNYFNLDFFHIQFSPISNH